MSRFLPDANVLLYALNSGAAHHTECRKWLEETTAAGGVIVLSELTECEVLRISSHSKIAFCPMDVALQFWQAFVGYPNIERATSGASQRMHFVRLINELELTGNDINDAWLASVAIDVRATLVSTDRGFKRFSGLAWLNPVAKN